MSITRAVAVAVARVGAFTLMGYIAAVTNQWPGFVAGVIVGAVWVYIDFMRDCQ